MTTLAEHIEEERGVAECSPITPESTASSTAMPIRSLYYNPATLPEEAEQLRPPSTSYLQEDEQNNEQEEEIPSVFKGATAEVKTSSSSSVSHKNAEIGDSEDIVSIGADGERNRVSSLRYREVMNRSSIDQAIHNILELLKPPSGEGKSQMRITACVLFFSFVLGACSLCFRHEIFKATDINAALILGSVGSLLMCSVVIGSFIWTKWYRRHMHILLLNLALCEFCLGLSFVLEPVWKSLGEGVGPGLSCHWLSIVREYLIMCSSAWTTCMALDLYYLMTDPFTSPRMNRRKYQFLVHTAATIAAILMPAFKAFDSPVAVGNFCWVGAKRNEDGTAVLARSGIWVFIVSPVVVSMGANIYVTFVSYGRFRDGIAATLKNRQVLLREGFLTTLTLIAYSAVLWGFYAAYWFVSSPTATDILSHIFAFLLSYRGSVAFSLWCLYKRPKKKRTRAKTTPTTQQEEQPTTAAGRRSSVTTQDLDEANDDAVRPQMNIALLEELVFYTTQGIAMAVRMVANNPYQHAPSYTFALRPSAGSTSALNECKFTDFRSQAFLQIRQLFGINDDEYLTSLANCTTPKVSEGASGSFMFYSSDRCYIVKSLTGKESDFLHSFLDAYVEYMTSQQDTFLTRFLGSYCIVLYGKKAHFVVMENVFDIQHGISIHQRYDIKGSWIDRNAQKAKTGSEATCRHCNMTFRCGIGRNVCPNRAGSHEPNVVLKDMDLTTKLRFGKAEGKKLLHQLKRDSDFLCDQGIMDYSLLLGVIEVSYQVNQQNILTRDGSVFLENMMASAEFETPDESTKRERIKQSTRCLRTSEVVIGPGFYYIGLIDILQTWNLEKRFERFMKTVLMRKDPEGISAMPPKPYRDRFHKKLDEIIHLGHNSIVIPTISPRQRHYSTTNSSNAMADKAYFTDRTTNILHAVPNMEHMHTENAGDDAVGNILLSSMHGQVRPID